MPTVNELKKSALNDAGYSGSISDAEYKWLKAICDPYVGSIPDMWRYALLQAGYPNSVTVGQNEMLVDLGHTGAMPNKWYKYWRDTPLQGVGGATIVLSVTSIAENAASGSVVGALSVISGSGSYTFSITADPDNKFAIDSANLEIDATLDYETDASHSVTIEADNGVDTPISRTFTITVTNVLEVTLTDPLTIDDVTAIPDELWSATITGKTSGSTITATSSDDTILTVVGTTVSGTFTSEGTPDVTLHETHPDAAPVDSVIAVTVAEVSGAAPDAFTVGQWTLSDNTAGNSLTITILTVPNLNGNTQTGTQYRINGGTWHDTSRVGLGDIMVVDAIELPNDTLADVEIRVLVAEYDWDDDGTGDEDSVSDTKSAEPTLVTTDVPDAFVDANWDLDPGDTTLEVTINSLPADNGATITEIEYRVDGGTWTSSGGVVSFSITGRTNGVEYDVELRAVNSIGAGAASDLKSATPEAAVTGLTYSFAGWINNDGVGGTSASANLDLGAAAADRFVLACAMYSSNPTLVSVPLGLPELGTGESWGRRGFYGDEVTTGSGSTTMTFVTGADATAWCPVFVIRGSTSLVVKDVQIGNPATVTVEAGDLVIAIQLYDTTEPWTNSPTEAAENTYAGVGGGFWKGYAAVFRATAPNAAFAPGVVSGRGERTALIVLGEP